MIRALLKEISERRGFLGGLPIETIYFGGGTPSLISAGYISELLDAIKRENTIEEQVELTLEANPEDLSESNLSHLKKLGFNRLSIGIQSFDDKALQAMNRIHDAKQAESAVKRAQHIGFDNISVDLIYGLPEIDMESFKKEVEQFIQLGVQHISAYALTIEPKTLFAHLLDKGQLKLPKEEEVIGQFDYLVRALENAGFEQYEVSNFSLSGLESRHNSSYWSGKNYMGLGPSAHSYDGHKRYWNVSNNFTYMAALEKGELMMEDESIDSMTRYNEYVLTRSRTKWGLDLRYMKNELGVDLLNEFSVELEKYRGTYSILDEHLILNSKGLILADGFASDLFLSD